MLSHGWPVTASGGSSFSAEAACGPLCLLKFCVLSVSAPLTAVVKLQNTNKGGAPVSTAASSQAAALSLT